MNSRVFGRSVFSRRGVWGIPAFVVIASVWSACSRDVQPGRPTPGPIRTLNVLTPHSEDIRSAFAAGFATWYFAGHGEQVHVNYIYRGTPQCVEYARAAPSLRTSGTPGVIPDILFGGGINDHVALVREKLSRPVELRDERTGPAPTIQGMPTRDPDFHWFATGLSTFGIVYNAAACAARGIEPPRTWADLADPRFFGWIAVAHPAASGSHRECMVLIVKHMGWDAGWGTLVRILASARALETRSGDALRQVRSGAALATFAVNFDGQALAADSGGDIVYLDPPGATAATPDVISVLRTAGDVRLAEAFVQYVLSEEGQALWGVKPEARTMPGRTLYHYPISADIYERYAEHLAVDRNPLKDEFGIRLDPDEAARLSNVLTPLIEALCGDGRHIQLQLLWRDVLARGADPALVSALTKPPIALDAAGARVDRCAGDDAAERAALVDEWRAEFDKAFATVRGALGG